LCLGCAENDEEEERTEDIVKAINAPCNQNFAKEVIDEDSTYEMLAGQRSNESSVDTEDVVPKENVSNLSKNRMSLGSQMDFSMGPLQVSEAPMEMTLAPEMSMLNNSEQLSQPPTPADMTLDKTSMMNKTSRNAVEMSFEDDAPLMGDKSCLKSLDKTNYLTADITVDEEIAKSKQPDDSQLGEKYSQSF
jgi:hypothetical protein